MWGVGDNTLDGDYEMDPDVVGDAVAARDGLAALPTLSLVIDAADLFGPIAGIYMHPEQDGRMWERPASAELFNSNRSATASGGETRRGSTVVGVGRRLCDGLQS